MLLLAVVAVILVLTMTVALLGRVAAARHSAQSAADLAALAAAATHVRQSEPCAIAQRVVELNDAELTACRVEGLHVVIDTRVSVAGFWARASSRAGPVE